MDVKSAIRIFDELQTDVFAYIGPVDRVGYDMLCKALEAKQRKPNCVLAVTTFGGDPNAGYRVARALSHNYAEGKLSILVPHYCKSAGTLICIGGHELVIADRGELGPLDIQVQKPDEMFKSASGLDIIRGLTYLQDAALNTFRAYLVDINQGSGLSTKSASEIASKLTIGLHEPIFAQIDPMRLGEMQAALTIALEYGTRLNERYRNLKIDALSKLATSYPAHGFVIDRKEARGLFQNVRIPEAHEQTIGDWVADVFVRESRRNTGLVLDCAAILRDEIDQSGESSIEEMQHASSESNESVEGQSGSDGAANDDGHPDKVAEHEEPANGSDEAHS